VGTSVKCIDAAVVELIRAGASTKAERATRDLPVLLPDGHDLASTHIFENMSQNNDLGGCGMATLVVRKTS
jgi:hypothetical protein